MRLGLLWLLVCFQISQISWKVGIRLSVFHDPWMDQQFYSRWTICWLFLEANIDKISEVIAKLTIIRHIRRILVFDLFKHLKESPRFCVWVWSCHKFHKNYTKTPDITFERIFFSFHSLRTHVIHCPYKSSSEPNRLIKLFCDSEICELDKTLTID